MDAARGEQKTRVFLSYSRKDKGFTRKLAEALAQRGYLVDFDQSEHDPANIETGISAEDDWWKRLREMIAAAEAMVLIVSPHSAASQVCGEEIAYARALGKRVVPVLLREIDFSKAPPRLSALNVKLSFVEEAAFDVSLNALAAVLDVDVAWHREGARLAALAERWDRDGQTDALLLSAGATDEAESWAARRPANSPPFGEPLISYIAAGRAKAVADRERLLTVTGRAFVKPAAQAVEESRYAAALRLTAAGTLLSEDFEMRLVPERVAAGLKAAWASSLRVVIRGHDDAVLHAAFSFDGTRIFTRSVDRTAGIWEAATGREMIRLKGVQSAVFSIDGSCIVTTSEKIGHIWDTSTKHAVATLQGLEENETVAALSSDGARVATISGANARIWDAVSGREMAVARGHTDAVASAVFSPSGAFLVTSSFDCTGRVWDVTTGHEIATLSGHENYVDSAVFSPNGARVLTASWDHSIRVWDATTGREITAIGWPGESQHLKPVFSPDGARIATTFGTTARLLDATTGHEIAVLRGHDDAVHDLAFSPDGGRIVTAAGDRTARIWDANTGREIGVLRGHDSSLNSASFSADGMRIVTTSADNSVCIWDSALAGEVAISCGHERAVKSASFSPDVKSVVSASDDCSARIWDSATGREIYALRGHKDQVTSASFSPDGAAIVTASNDCTARLWSSSTGAETAVLRGHSDYVRSAAFDQDGAHIVTASWDTYSRVWETRTGRETAKLQGHEDKVHIAVFSPDGMRIATASEDKTARVWDAVTGRELAILKGHDGAVESVAFSPDGDRVVTASMDNSARVWDSRTGHEIMILRGHRSWVKSAAFSPDGAHIVTISGDHTGRVWSSVSGHEVAVLCGHRGRMWGGVFSPDGTRVVTSGDNTARIWDAVNGNEIAVLGGHSSEVFSAVFNKDGDQVVTASYDRTCRIWDVRRTTALLGSPAEVIAACTVNGRGVLTKSERMDLLLRSIPDEQNDLGKALMERLAQERRENVARRSEMLARSLNPSCYLAPSQRAGLSLSIDGAPSSEAENALAFLEQSVPGQADAAAITFPHAGNASISAELFLAAWVSFQESAGRKGRDSLVAPMPRLARHQSFDQQVECGNSYSADVLCRLLVPEGALDTAQATSEFVRENAWAFGQVSAKNRLSGRNVYSIVLSKVMQSRWKALTATRREELLTRAAALLNSDVDRIGPTPAGSFLDGDEIKKLERGSFERATLPTCRNDVVRSFVEQLHSEPHQTYYRGRAFGSVRRQMI